MIGVDPFALLRREHRGIDQATVGNILAVGAIAWAFWLAAGLFEALYEWRGSQAVLGGLLCRSPVHVQLEVW